MDTNTHNIINYKHISVVIRDLHVHYLWHVPERPAGRAPLKVCLFRGYVAG